MEIQDILRGLGVSLPAEKQQALQEAVAQSYVSREEHKSVLAQQRFDALLEARMTAAGVRSGKAVKAMLDMDELKKNPSREQMDEALAALKTSDGYLFAGMPPMAGGAGSADLTPKNDSMEAILRAAMGNY